MTEDLKNDHSEVLAFVACSGSRDIEPDLQGNPLPARPWPLTDTKLGTGRRSRRDDVAAREMRSSVDGVRHQFPKERCMHRSVSHPPTGAWQKPARLGYIPPLASIVNCTRCAAV